MTLVPALLALAAVVAQPAPPLEACRIIEPTAAQRQTAFSNAIALGPFAMRTLAGESRCDFPRAGEGRCSLRDPRLVHVTMDARHVWYEIPAGGSALIDVADGTATCRFSRD